jgi:hypothetical protein
VRTVNTLQRALVVLLLWAACKQPHPATGVDPADAGSAAADAVAGGADGPAPRDGALDLARAPDGPPTSAPDGASVDAPMGDGATPVFWPDAASHPEGGSTFQGKPCGRPGQPCCAYGVCAGAGDCCVEDHCVPAGLRCPQGLGTCAAGSCGGCGGAGQLCCTDSRYPRCTEPYTDCAQMLTGGTVMNFCRRCGRAGDPCCGSEGTCSTPDLACQASSPHQCVKCGVPGGPCCAGDRCNGDGCCESGKCRSPGESCGGPGNVCQQGRCSACGSADQPCCAGYKCQQPNTSCIGGDVSSFNPGVCRPCGQPGGIACRSGPSCCLAPDNTCVPPPQGGESLCLPCGQRDQRCCFYDILYCAAGLGCNGSACVTCGGPGQPCCANETCGGTLSCLYGTCQSAGGPGEPCLPGGSCKDGGCCILEKCSGNGTACKYSNAVPIWGTCRNGACDGCGAVGQPCCPGPTSNEDPYCGAPGALCVKRKTCAACGKPGQPCCEHARCDSGGCCAAPDPTNQGRLCVAAGQACSAFPNGGACQADGNCAGCGTLDAPCCGDSACLTPDTACSGAPVAPKCDPCGRPGQHCCDDASPCQAGARCEGRWCQAL